MHYYFFLYGPVPNELWPITSPQPCGWGPLLYAIANLKQSKLNIGVYRHLSITNEVLLCIYINN